MIKLKICIIDNGKGAQELAKLIPSSTIFSAKDYQKALKGNYDAYVLTDGDTDEKKQDAAADILDAASKPVLAIGFGYLCLGAMMGADVVECKPIKKNAVLPVKHGSPLTTDLKAINVYQEFDMKLENIPDDVMMIAPIPTGDIIQDVEHPCIGINFLPEKSKDGPMILKNFLKFVEVYDQYHK